MSYVRKPRKPLYGHQVNKFIDEFDDLYYDGVKVMCEVCDKALMCCCKSDCTRHVKSVQHKNRKQGMPLQTEFRFDLLLTLIACNIPLHILNNQPFRKFWHKHNLQFQLPSRATLWNHIPALRQDIIEKITCTLQNKRLWLCIDETTDRQKNSIVNIVVRVLDPQQSTYPLLLASKRLSECTNNTITQMLFETLEKFQVPPSQILLFVTDGTATMRSVGRSLSQHGCSLLHITCKVHTLHLVAETIRQCFPKVDALIVNTEKVFVKSPKCLREFHEKCSGIPEPPQSMLTHWGTWLKAALYYAEYFQQIKAVILQFNPAEAAAIKKSQTEYRDSSIETDLKTIHANYKGVADAIERLQNSALALEESLQIVNEVNSLLHSIDDKKNDHVKQKFESVLRKDTDFNRLRQICEIIPNSDNVSTDPLSKCEKYFTHACITSVDVQRSFSKYKNIFSPQRTSLSETNMETYLMLQSFYGSSLVGDDDHDASSSR